MDETPQLTAYCHHYQRAAEVVGQRWMPQILRASLSGVTRFSEFTSSIPGLSDRLLSERLKALEADGLMVREVVPETPVRIEYRLTEKGRGLADVVGELAVWAEHWVTLEEIEATS